MLKMTQNPGVTGSFRISGGERDTFIHGDVIIRTGEMAPWLRSLVILAGNLGLVPSIHMATQNYL